MELLLNNRLSPITKRFGFIEKDPVKLVDDFKNWHMEIGRLKPALKEEYKERIIEGSLEQILLNLLPLSVSHQDRYLFIPTKSNWTAYFANGFRGTDGSAIAYLAERCHCRSIMIIATPFIVKKEESRGYEGGLMMKVYGPKSENTIYNNLIRSIWLEKDMGKWKFIQEGVPLPFEKLERYKERNKKDKFSLEILNEYLIELGINAFQEEFYLPKDTKATLIEMKSFSKTKHLSIEEARHYYDKK